MSTGDKVAKGEGKVKKKKGGNKNRRKTKEKLLKSDKSQNKVGKGDEKRRKIGGQRKTRTGELGKGGKERLGQLEDVNLNRCDQRKNEKEYW